MQRRRALQIGVALATLPLGGCGAEPPEPKTAPAGGKGVAGGEKVAAGAPATSADPGAAPAPTASATASAGDAGKDPGGAPPADARKNDAPPAFSRVIARVGKNHGHELTVAFADVMAGAEKTYEIRGTAGHGHTVTLTAGDMKSLQKGDVLRTVSSRGLHAHRVLVRCAPPVDPPEWVSVCHVEFSGKDEHEMVIPAADMAAKVKRSYDVQGIAGHAHTLEITPADFQKLEKGEAVSLQTSRLEEDAHMHVVFIQYRPPKKG